MTYERVLAHYLVRESSFLTMFETRSGDTDERKFRISRISPASECFQQFSEPEICELIRQLIQKDDAFNWTSEHDETFKKLSKC